jgi:hypothetical protein
LKGNLCMCVCVCGGLCVRVSMKAEYILSHSHAPHNVSFSHTQVTHTIQTSVPGSMCPPHTHVHTNAHTHTHIYIRSHTHTHIHYVHTLYKPLCELDVQVPCAPHIRGVLRSIDRAHPGEDVVPGRAWWDRIYLYTHTRVFGVV